MVKIIMHASSLGINNQSLMKPILYLLLAKHWEKPFQAIFHLVFIEYSQQFY